MRKVISGIVIVLLYGFPYVYFSMHQDFANRSMFGYLVMIIVTSILAFLVKRFSHVRFLIIGNLLSAIISLYFVGEMAGNEEWNGYFKPLSPYHLVLFVSVLNVLPQFFVMKLANRFRVERPNI